jgi:tetratricopeptide (TPR) repeat protein
VQLKPEDAHNRYALGWTYSKLGWYAESAREYKEALQLKPDYEDARESLEWVSFRLKAQEPKRSVKENPAKRDSNVGIVTTPYQPTKTNEPKVKHIN